MAIKGGHEQRESEPDKPQQDRSQHSGPQRSIVLIRHGTTRWNVEKKYLGHTDIGLLPDAQDELASLREQCRDITWDDVYCSDLLRCRQTLAHITPQVAAQTKFDARLRENDFGLWEGMNYEQLKNNPQYRNWIDHPREVTPPEGETWQVFAGRIDSFLHDHIWSEVTISQRIPHKTIQKTSHQTTQRISYGNSHRTLIVTHGGVIRYMLSRLMDSVEFWDTHVIPGQAIQVDMEKQGEHWLGRRVNFPPVGL
ncbi:histidine phosphatase family protein [Paenibacillus amylolyticus]|uniref:histidine phosphatase family protein n=1 Tax=Paenibacillus amylolyticus TaxID=1451 RepID=UPI003EBA88E2